MRVIAMSDVIRSNSEELDSQDFSPIDFDRNLGVERFLMSVESEVKKLQMVQRQLNWAAIEREQIYIKILAQIRLYRTQIRVDEFRSIVKSVVFDRHPLSFSNAKSYYCSDYLADFAKAYGIPLELLEEYEKDPAKIDDIIEYQRAHPEVRNKYGLEIVIDACDGTFPIVERPSIVGQSVIYILRNATDEIIYIGKSRGINQRLKQHQSGPFKDELKSFTLISVPDELLDAEERKMIYTFAPKHNKNHSKWNYWAHNVWAF